MNEREEKQKAAGFRVIHHRAPQTPQPEKQDQKDENNTDLSTTIENLTINQEELHALKWKFDELERIAESLTTGNVSHHRGNLIQIIWSIRRDLTIQNKE